MTSNPALNDNMLAIRHRVTISLVTDMGHAGVLIIQAEPGSYITSAYTSTLFSKVIKTKTTLWGSHG